MVEVDPDYRPRLRSGPMVISDAMRETRSMADGCVYDSKSAYYGHLKREGYEILGNDRPQGPAYEPAITERDVRDAVQQVEAGKGYKGGRAPQGWEE